MGANFKSFISEKVTVVPGDITLEGLAIKDLKLKEELWSDIDVIINLAATTNFDERYDVSLSLNTFGAKNVLDFAKKCTKLKVLIQVSTGLNMIKCRSNHWGWPNVYVFTKALGEMLLKQEKEDIPLVFIRPTIVTSTFKEPFPGWVEGIRTIDSLAIAYGKGRLPCIPGDPNCVVDAIPADMVVNAILVAAMAHANDKGNLAIYHVGSSVKNPVSFKTLFDVAYQYFKHHPWIKNDGTPVILGHVKILTTMSSYNAYFFLHYLLPLKVVEIVNMALCQYFKGTCMYMRRNIYYMKRLINIYKPYLFYMGIYDDINTEKLRIASRERGAETDSFHFDPKDFDWNDYFMNIHLPGVVKYVLKR
ncbi:alcohol-forming fatty acyl-CoA reductase-like [Silene latifolia]|uniref:alcohol-forming fatty acyl-CoA reductase-like n=1 Tax=Silene latifolia TaxID=37657 RepID=UPI003D771C12